MMCYVLVFKIVFQLSANESAHSLTKIPKEYVTFLFNIGLMEQTKDIKR